MDGLEKSVNKSTYTPSFDFDSLFDGELSEGNKKIKAHAYNLNESLHIKQVSEEVNALVDGLPGTLDELCVKLALSKSVLWSEPVFKYVDIKKLNEKVTQLNNPQLAAFRNCLDERYRASNIHECPVVSDYENLLLLKELLDQHIKQQSFVLSTHIKNELSKTIEKVASKLRPN